MKLLILTKIQRKTPAMFSDEGTHQLYRNTRDNSMLRRQHPPEFGGIPKQAQCSTIMAGGRPFQDNKPQILHSVAVYFNC